MERHGLPARQNVVFTALKFTMNASACWQLAQRRPFVSNGNVPSSRRRYPTAPLGEHIA